MFFCVFIPPAEPFCDECCHAFSLGHFDVFGIENMEQLVVAIDAEAPDVSLRFKACQLVVRGAIDTPNRQSITNEVTGSETSSPGRMALRGWPRHMFSARNNGQSPEQMGAVKVVEKDGAGNSIEIFYIMDAWERSATLADLEAWRRVSSHASTSPAPADAQANPSLPVRGDAMLPTTVGPMREDRRLAARVAPYGGAGLPPARVEARSPAASSPPGPPASGAAGSASSLAIVAVSNALAIPNRSAMPDSAQQRLPSTPKAQPASDGICPSTPKVASAMDGTPLAMASPASSDAVSPPVGGRDLHALLHRSASLESIASVSSAASLATGVGSATDDQLIPAAGRNVRARLEAASKEAAAGARSL